MQPPPAVLSRLCYRCSFVETSGTAANCPRCQFPLISESKRIPTCKPQVRDILDRTHVKVQKAPQLPGVDAERVRVRAGNAESRRAAPPSLVVVSLPEPVQARPSRTFVALGAAAAALAAGVVVFALRYL